MNKVLGILLLSVTSLLPLQVFADSGATRFVSPNFAVESVIIGGTGVLRSSAASIPPVILTGPTTSNITTSSVDFTWTTDKPSNSVVLMGTVSGVYPIQGGEIGDTTFTNHLVTVGQLNRGTTYFYKIRSTDVAGNVTESPEKTVFTDPGDITPPIILTGPSVANNSASSITVTWTTEELSSTIVEYGLKSVTENSIGHPDDLTLFHQVVISGLLPGQSYVYRIKSRDAAGNLYTGPIQNLNTLQAPNITDVKISDITLDSALIQWSTTSPSSSVVNYGTTSGYGQVVQDLSLTQNHLVHLSGLLNGTIYKLRLSGADASNNSLQSDEYTFRTVILPIISDFKATSIGADTVTLNWNSSSDIDELVHYTITKISPLFDPSLQGKQSTAGSEKLVSVHTLQLTDLQGDSDYTVSVDGKDVFGNKASSATLTFHTLHDSEPPKILNVKTDTSVNLGSKQTVQVLVSFGLNKLGKSIIEYGEGSAGSYNQKVTTDVEFTQNKFLIIPNLQPGQSYHFHIVATDRSKNTATSADYLVLAPSQQVSLLDLIFGQVQQNFGWLSKLGPH